MSEKQIGMELQKTVKALEKAKENAIEQMGEAIGLAADAGDILLSARVEGLDLDTIQEVAGINGEQGLEGMSESPKQGRPSKPPPPAASSNWHYGQASYPTPSRPPTPRPRWLGTHTSSRQGNGSPARALPNGHQPKRPSSLKRQGQ
jgi:hypothetical protein